MRAITYVDFDKGIGLDEYRRKSIDNIKVFEEIFGKSPAEIDYKRFQQGSSENIALLDKIIGVTRLPKDVVLGANAADEELNGGCTSVALDGIIGQTMDLFTVDLVVMREGGALYITMPPYLTLMGMNKNIAFCTNFINGLVRDGVPVAHIRRDILRQQSLEQATNYLLSVDRATPVNFLLTDGETVVDVELCLNETRIHAQKKHNRRNYCAHTNHIVTRSFEDDKECSRLTRAVKLLREGRNIAEILDDKIIKQRIMPLLGLEVDFGSIVHTIMDVKTGKLQYGDSFMREYATVSV